MSGHTNFQVLQQELDEKLRADPERRARVEQLKHVNDSVLNITRLREAQGVAPEAIMKAWETAQECGGRATQSGSIYLATIGAYVAALGGNLQLTAVFPDQSITLTLPDDTMTESPPVPTVMTEDATA
ncbi:MAG: hypothetical protein ACR2PL_16280 [Dehalococcoidia bacterium]